MKQIYSVEAIREVERTWFAAHPGVDLMERAANAIAHHAWELIGEDSPWATQGANGLPSSREDDTPHPKAVTSLESPPTTTTRYESDTTDTTVGVVVGPGNNGGDGIMAAAILSGWGLRVAMWAPAGARTDVLWRDAIAAGVEPLEPLEAVEVFANADLVIDAFAGIGGRSGLPETVALMAQELANADVPVLSVDIPSGLQADSHLVTDSFKAIRTIALLGLKRCHVAEPAASRCGEVMVENLDVDLPARGMWQQCQPAEVATHWPVPESTSNKYSRGVLGLDTGSIAFPGAALLGAIAATHCGPGMVRFAGENSIAGMLVQRVPSVVVGEGRVQAWVCGSGWGSPDRERLMRRIDDGVPLVIDAEAMDIAAQVVADLPVGCLFTPHAGELARLLGVERHEIESEPDTMVRRAAHELNQTVLLKGATQYLAMPDIEPLAGTLRAESSNAVVGDVPADGWLQSIQPLAGRIALAVPGPAWTAQAGSGDVLAATAGVLLAAGLPAPWAGLLAASIQAMAATNCFGPWPPDYVAERMPETIAHLVRYRM